MVCALFLDQLHLLLGGGIAHIDAQREPVQLCLRQGIGPVVLDRVLGGDDHERVAHRVGPAFDGDLAFAHALEQCALRAGRGAVDLIGEQDMAEDRAGAEGESAVLGRVDHAPDDIGREQVRRELDPMEVAGDGLGKGLAQSCLAHAGDVLDQDVSPGAERGDDQLGGVCLALDDAVKVVGDSIEGFPAVHAPAPDRFDAAM